MARRIRQPYEAPGGARVAGLPIRCARYDRLVGYSTRSDLLRERDCAVRAKLIERHASHNVRGRSGLLLPESETAAQNDMLRGVLAGVRSEPGPAPGRSARRWGIVGGTRSRSESAP